MTSAQNRPQLLSGNNTILFLLSLFLIVALSACDPIKKIPDTSGGGELDPVTGKDNNPSNNGTGEDIVKVVSKPEAPDTVRWIPVNPSDGGVTPVDPNPKDPTDPDPNNPIDTVTSDPINPNNKANIPSGVIKSSYDVAVLLPLYSADFASTKKLPKRNSTGRKSLDFYEGVLMGLRKVEAEGGTMTVNVFDTRSNSISSLVEKSEVKNADFVIGPVSVGNVKEFANYAKQNGNIMLSMNSSEGIAIDNPYYMQASPSFSTHCETIAKYAKDKYSNGNVVLLGRGNEATSFEKFQSANTNINGGANRYNEYFVSGTSVNYDIRSITSYLSKTDTNVVIIPSNNEGFVKSMLRELSLIHRTYPMVVFGLPRWTRFYNISPDHLTKLNVHLTSSVYINRKDPNVQAFKLAYFNEYGAAPTVESFKGYDFAMYFGRLLKSQGTNLLQGLESNPSKLLHSEVNFRPSYTPMPANAMGEGLQKVKQFENKYINILRYDNFQFVRMH